MSSDVISAPSTIANSTRPPNDRSNVLFEQVRPNYRNGMFSKAIARQRVNLLAICAFRNSICSEGRTHLQKKPTVVVSHSILDAPRKFKRTAKLVTDLLMYRNIKKRKERTEINNQISMSQNNYQKFLLKNQNEKDKELRGLKRSEGSQLAKGAMYRKHQLEKSRKAMNEHISKVEKEKEESQKKWAQKCILSCSTTE